MYVAYSVLFILIGLALLPGLLWRCLKGAGYHQGLSERFGYGAAVQRAMEKGQGGLWFHAASVGEIQGLLPILTHLHRRFPNVPILCSTFTPSGKMMAQRLIPDAASIFLLPFDLPWITKRVVQRLQPQAIIVQETELWPHLFRAAARQHVPVVVVNGRLSPRSARRYGWIRQFMQRVLADVRLLLVQTEEIERRFRNLGVIDSRLKVVGNTNIDRALLAAEGAGLSFELTSLLKGRRLLVAGSTHEGEETVFLNAYKQLRVQNPDLLLVLAPRHMERVETVVRHVQASRYTPVRRSVCQATESSVLDGDVVLILDTLGELAALYQLCTIAFVGGSLVPIGGHNILEPAVFAKPLLFGPHMHHFPELAQMLCEAGGAIQIRDEDDLYLQLERLLRQPEAAQRLGQHAVQALQANRGALAETCEAVVAILPCDLDGSRPVTIR